MKEIDFIQDIWRGWKVIEKIGEGSYGKVYKIEKEAGKTRFREALKVISIPKEQSFNDRLRFEYSLTDDQIKGYLQDQLHKLEDEIDIMVSLNYNNNAVKISDFYVHEKKDEVGWLIFIRMELVKDIGKIPIEQFTKEEVVKLGKDILNILRDCEERDIIHRDIKPSNIFISDNGDYKLGDFGIARELSKNGTSMTQIGTMNYVAPEVINTRRYGSNVDLYSLGLVMFKLLNNNRLPFMPTGQGLLTFGMEEEAKNRRMAGEKINKALNADEKLQKILEKACEYSPVDRYQKADEMLEDLLDYERDLKEKKRFFLEESIEQRKDEVDESQKDDARVLSDEDEEDLYKTVFLKEDEKDDETVFIDKNGEDFDKTVFVAEMNEDLNKGTVRYEPSINSDKKDYGQAEPREENSAKLTRLVKTSETGKKSAGKIAIFGLIIFGLVAALLLTFYFISRARNGESIKEKQVSTTKLDKAYQAKEEKNPNTKKEGPNQSTESQTNSAGKRWVGSGDIPDLKDYKFVDIEKIGGVRISFYEGAGGKLSEGYYIGEVDENGLPDGKGAITYVSNDIKKTYSGGFKEGYRYGDGIIVAVKSDKDVKIISDRYFTEKGSRGIYVNKRVDKNGPEYYFAKGYFPFNGSGGESTLYDGNKIVNYNDFGVTFYKIEGNYLENYSQYNFTGRTYKGTHKFSSDYKEIKKISDEVISFDDYQEAIKEFSDLPSKDEIKKMLGV